MARKSPLLREFYGDIAEEVALKGVSGVILDVGSGPGYLPIWIAKRHPAIQVIGLDISPDMIKVASMNVKKAGLSNRVTFRAGDVSQMPFPNQFFDFIVSTMSLHHWLDPVRGLAEIFRVLKTGGEAWIYDLRRDMPKEVRRKIRERYGWLISSIFLRVVASHSSLTLKHVKEILEKPDIRFKRWEIDERGPLIRIRLFGTVK